MRSCLNIWFNNILATVVIGSPSDLTWSDEWRSVQKFCIHVSSRTAEVCVSADTSTFKSVKEHKWGLRVEMNHIFENCVKPPYIVRRHMSRCEWHVAALDGYIFKNCNPQARFYDNVVTLQIQFELVSQECCIGPAFIWPILKMGLAIFFVQNSSPQVVALGQEWWLRVR